MTSSYDDAASSRSSDRADWAGQRAMAWVIDDAPVPVALFPTLMVIARRCDEHGKGSYQSVVTISEKTGKSADQVKRDIRELKRLGLLVPGDASIVAAFPIWKRPAVYDVPLHISGPKPTKESKNKTGGTRQGGGMDAPPGMDATGWHGSPDRGGMDALGGGGMDAPLTKPLKNPSNNPLSPEVAATPSTAAVPAQRTEREDVKASPEQKTENPIHRLLLDAGCPSENLDEVQGELIARFEPRSPAWWRTVAKNGDLPDHVGEVLEALEPITASAHAPHLADAHSFTPKDDDSGDCQHCPFPARNGRHKVGNQSGAYISQRMMPGADFKPSTSAARARQGLQVADELDRQFGHGEYAPGVIRSPADQRVADGAVLYNHYKSLEGESA